MLRILVNAVSAKSGGAATYIRNLGSDINSIRDDYRFIFYVPYNHNGHVPWEGANIEFFKSDVAFRAIWRRLVWDQIVLRQIIKEEKVDLLLSSSDFGMLSPPARQILLIRNPLFFSHVYLEQIFPRKSLRFRVEFLLRRKLISLSAYYSNAIITASESMLNDVRRFISIPENKAFVNPFGVPLDKFVGVRRETRRHKKSLNDKLNLLYVSEYSDYKNLTTLLKAILFLREQGVDDFCLTTTADPDQFRDVEIVDRDIDESLASHPLVSPSVNFTGSIPYGEIQKLYQESDIFVFPSIAESFGHPLVEAMASGLPIIASDIPICREMCGNAALYFSPMSHEELANKIVTLMHKPNLRIQLGGKGRRQAETHFDWKDHVRRLIDIIEQVTCKNPS